MTPWEIRGTELINCNCSYGCPCQFNAPPTHGHCQAMGAIQIDEGHFGSTRLDGLRIAVVFKWPGAIHQGNGECQPVVDVKADAAQRESLLKIMSGQETEPFATMFSVFAATIVKMHDPIFTQIDFDVDVDARRGEVHVQGVFDLSARPIRNPVTGNEHRARIHLPQGFEYEIAEVGSASSRSKGALVVELQDSYAQFAHLHLNNKGVVRQSAGA